MKTFFLALAAILATGASINTAVNYCYKNQTVSSVPVNSSPYQQTATSTMCPVNGFSPMPIYKEKLAMPANATDAAGVSVNGTKPEADGFAELEVASQDKTPSIADYATPQTVGTTAAGLGSIGYLFSLFGSKSTDSKKKSSKGKDSETSSSAADATLTSTSVDQNGSASEENGWSVITISLMVAGGIAVLSLLVFAFIKFSKTSKDSASL